MKTALTILLLAVAIVTPLPAASNLDVSPSHPRIPLGRSHWESLAIVVNQKNPIDNLTIGELRQIFIGERRWWTSRRRIGPITLPRGAAERKTMLQVVYRMNDSDLDKYVLFGQFRGEFTGSPTTVDTPGDVKMLVSTYADAIGYLRVSDVDSSLKVVRVNGLLPGEDGYPLRLRPREGNNPSKP